MTWNYRMIQHENTVSVHEVYYTDAGEPCMYTQDPVELTSEDSFDIYATLQFVMDDLIRFKTILKYPEDFVDPPDYSLEGTPLDIGPND